MAEYTLSYTAEEIDRKLGEVTDWNAKEGESGYVKNRTHWEEVGESVELLPETTVVLEGGQGYIKTENVSSLMGGETCVVTWNGVEYVCTAIDGGIGICVGDIYAFSGGQVGTESTGEPFVIAFADGGARIMCADGSTEVTLSIVSKCVTVHKIDQKYLPKINDSSYAFENGVVSKNTIINTVRGEAICPEVGVTTYGELVKIRGSSVLYEINIDNSSYIGVSMVLFGTSSDYISYIGKCNIVALDGFGRGCVIKILLDGIDNESVVTSIQVEYTKNPDETGAQ